MPHLKETVMHSLLAPLVLGMASIAAEAPARQLGPEPATILVRLPADAKLTVDGAATKSTSAVRWLMTPPLERGREFHYTFEASFVRGNTTVTLKKNVAVRAGRETVVSFSLPGDRAAYSLPRGSETRAYYFAP